MAFQLVNTNPLTDTFEDQADIINNNANQSVDSGIINGNNIQLNRSGGGSPILIPIPSFANQVNSGLNVTTPLPNTVNYTAGSYQINNRIYSVGSGSFTVPNAGAGETRIDAVVAVDDLSPPTGTVQIVAGTSALNPTAPTLLSNQLLISLIIVNDAGTIVPPTPSDCCVPDGTINGQTLRWNQPTTEWLTNNEINVLPGQVSVNATFGVNITATLLGATSTLLISPPNAVTIIANTLGANSATYTSGRFAAPNRWGHSFATTGQIRITAPQGIEIDQFPAAPVSTFLKLYAQGVDLYWNGLQICTEPCGGGYTPTVDGSTLEGDTTTGGYIENTANLMQGDRITLIQSNSAIPPLTADIQYTTFISTTDITIDTNGFVLRNSIIGAYADLNISIVEDVFNAVIFCTEIDAPRSNTMHIRHLEKNGVTFETRTQVLIVTGTLIGNKDASDYSLPAGGTFECDPSPLNGQIARIFNGTGGASAPGGEVAIEGNGNNINGSATVFITEDEGCITLKYYGAPIGQWIIISKTF